MARINLLVRCTEAFEKLKKEFPDTRVPEFKNVEKFCTFIEESVMDNSISSGTMWAWKAYIEYCQKHHTSQPKFRKERGDEVS